MSSEKDKEKYPILNAPRKKRGRPPKAKVASKIKRNAVGRPKGEAGIMQEYKARMLASPKSKKVMDSIFEAALDHEHKNQAAAWKLLMDRMLPVSMFEKEVDSGAGSRPTVNITIGSIGEVPTIIDNMDEDIIDGE